MTSCCHCGRRLYYKKSVDQGCGYWYLIHKGECGSSYHHPELEGMKQAGLYSGQKDKGGASISPASASEFEKYCKLLKEQL